MDFDKGNTRRWQAEFVPSMSDIEKLMLPSSVGHMVIVARPVEDPNKSRIDLYGSIGEDFGKGSRFLGPSRGGFSFGGGDAIMKGGTIGSASISSGSVHGRAREHTGEVRDSHEGKPIIYHLRTLMFREDHPMDPEILAEVTQTLDNYISRN